MLRNDYPWEDPDAGGVHEHKYSLWSCAGCEEATLEWEVAYPGPDTDEKWQEMNDGFYFPQYFPPRSQSSIQGKQFQKLSPTLSKLYSEVITCFNQNSLILCTIGLRALIEAVCRDKDLKGRNLEEKVNGLIKLLPSVNLIEALHAFRLAGNRAAHDGEIDALSRDETRQAIEVVQDLLNFLYDLDYKASQLGNASSKGILKSRVVH